jgi:Ubiquitin-activating enzyme E1 FCCH domain
VLSLTGAGLATPGVSSPLVVTGNSTATSGVPYVFTVTAKNADGSTNTGYTGTVRFLNGDIAGQLPAASPLTNGVGVFSASLGTAGNRAITCIDSITGSITGTSPSMTVIAPPYYPATGWNYIDAVNDLTSIAYSFIYGTGIDGVNFNPVPITYTVPNQTGAVTGATNASPTVITSSNHGLRSGQTATISGIGGNTGANGAHVVTVLTANTFSIAVDTSAGSAYTSGGTWSAPVYSIRDQRMSWVGLNGGRWFFLADTNKWTGTGNIYFSIMSTDAERDASGNMIMYNWGSNGGLIPLIPVVPGGTVTTAYNPDIITDPLNGNLSLGFVASTNGDQSGLRPYVAPLNTAGDYNTGWGTAVAVGPTDGSGISDVKFLPITISLYCMIYEPVNSQLGHMYTSTALAGTYTAATTMSTLSAPAGSSTINPYPSIDNVNWIIANDGVSVSGAGNEFYTTQPIGAGDWAHGGASGISGTVSYPNQSVLAPSGHHTLRSWDPHLVPGTAGTGTATRLTFTGLTGSATAGNAIVFSVTATDLYNFRCPSYSGTVHFTTSDTNAGASTILPANATLTSGTGTFSATLTAVGTQTLTATDVSVSSITGVSSAITISAAAAATFIMTAGQNVTAGAAITNLQMTARDVYNNIVAGYAGTVHFASSDTGAITLPANSTFSNGIGNFSATLVTAGHQTITATDTVTSSITGYTIPFINVAAAAMSKFGLTTPATVTAGGQSVFTVTAQDPYSNTITGYAGTVDFTSTDGAATLPASRTLTAGVGTFSSTLNTVGTQTITAADHASPSINGHTNGITVAAAGATNFVVTSPSTNTVGNALVFTVTAKDGGGNTVTGYNGTVDFTCTDADASTVLPASSTLTNGVGIFSATLTLQAAQTITATDHASPSIVGHSPAITVAIPPATTILNVHTSAYTDAALTTLANANGNSVRGVKDSVGSFSYTQSANVGTIATSANGFRELTMAGTNVLIPTAGAFNSGAASIVGTTAGNIGSVIVVARPDMAATFRNIFNDGEWAFSYKSASGTIGAISLQGYGAEAAYAFTDDSKLHVFGDTYTNASGSSANIESWLDGVRKTGPGAGSSPNTYGNGACINQIGGVSPNLFAQSWQLIEVWAGGLTSRQMYSEHKRLISTYTLPATT